MPLALHQLGPEAPLVVAGHLDQFQPLHLIDPRRHALRLRDRPNSVRLAEPTCASNSFSRVVPPALVSVAAI